MDYSIGQRLGICLYFIYYISIDKAYMLYNLAILKLTKFWKYMYYKFTQKILKVFFSEIV